MQNLFTKIKEVNHLILNLKVAPTKFQLVMNN